MESWTITSEEGAITFDSILDMDASHGGEALTKPVEEGGFMTYNKVQQSTGLEITLARQGTAQDQQETLDQLEDLKTKPILISLSTPSALYENMTLEEYSYSRSANAGATLLVVQLKLVEVREIEAQVSFSPIKVKNPTSASNKDTGSTQTSKDESFLTKLGKIFRKEE